jgi:DNA excision repair protein ERCC-3
MKPLIVQDDRTLLLEVDHPDFEEIRSRLLAFAELEKSPAHIYIYRITALSLWNAAAAGMSAEEILELLARYGRYPTPAALRQEITEFIERYGQLSLRAVAGTGELELHSASADLLAELLAKKTLAGHFAGDAENGTPRPGAGGSSIRVKPESRGALKVALIKLGYPVEDLAGYRDGAPLEVRLRDRLPDGSAFTLRAYQREAVEAFYGGGRTSGGHGVIVLPCGAGKTVVGIATLEKVGSQALILTTNVTALRQWRRELLEKTHLTEDLVGEYSGETKEIRPVTLTTYQMLTYRRHRSAEFTHLKLFTARNWGLIIYDEVHLLPAPVFRFTADIQATRRLGLTATLVREDHREMEVFSLIGPSRYDVPWRQLETAGWIANATCVEVRVDMSEGISHRYARADGRGRFRLASENPRKLEVVRGLVARHRSGDRVLIIGQYLDQLRVIHREIGAPMITGRTANEEREELYARFRSGDIPVLIVSKVGNFAVDLPDASVAVQVSGTFGSRQEEAQRLGRILRPKSDGRPAIFYSVVTRSSRDQEFAERRQLFLTEQGYSYTIVEDHELTGKEGAFLDPRSKKRA